METIKVKPWGDGQGDHVVINAEDFNPALHQVLDGDAQESHGDYVLAGEPKRVPTQRRSPKGAA